MEDLLGQDDEATGLDAVADRVNLSASTARSLRLGTLGGRAVVDAFGRQFQDTRRNGCR